MHRRISYSIRHFYKQFAISSLKQIILQIYHYIPFPRLIE